MAEVSSVVHASHVTRERVDRRRPTFPHDRGALPGEAPQAPTPLDSTFVEVVAADEPRQLARVGADAASLTVLRESDPRLSPPDDESIVPTSGYRSPEQGVPWN